MIVTTMNLPVAPMSLAGGVVAVGRVAFAVVVVVLVVEEAKAASVAAVTEMVRCHARHARNSTERHMSSIINLFNRSESLFFLPSIF